VAAQGTPEEVSMHKRIMAGVAGVAAAASGALNEVDLEHRAGRLVFNVDVGSHDVEVDATTGDVVAVDADD
jgi:uncharacterized membrane protein YkoI